MKRCKECRALNADHALICTNCQAELEEKPLVIKKVDKDKETKYLLVSLLSILLILYGIYVIIAGFFDRSLEFGGFIFIMIGVAINKFRSRFIDLEEHVTKIENENIELQKLINEIKDDSNRN